MDVARCIGCDPNCNCRRKEIEMAIVFHDTEILEEFPLGHHDCFFCSQPFIDLSPSDQPAIMWDGGSQGELWLHSDCFIKMAMGMFRDVHELELVQSISKYHGDTASDAYMQSIRKRIR